MVAPQRYDQVLRRARSAKVSSVFSISSLRQNWLARYSVVDFKMPCPVSVRIELAMATNQGSANWLTMRFGSPAL